MIYIAYVAYKGEAEDVAQATKHGRAQAEQKEGKAKQRKSPIMETGSILVADILNYTRMHAVYIIINMIHVDKYMTTHKITPTAHCSTLKMIYK